METAPTDHPSTSTDAWKSASARNIAKLAVDIKMIGIVFAGMGIFHAPLFLHFSYLHSPDSPEEQKN